MGRNIKGFTLAELMGVIVLLAILALIIVPVVDRNLKKGRTVTCETQEKSILEAAKNWNSDNVTMCTNKGEVCTVKVIELVQRGYLPGSDSLSTKNPINPATGNPYHLDTEVQINNVSGTNYVYTLMYKGDDKNTCGE